MLIYGYVLLSTGQKSPFSDAIKKGHVQMVSSEQTINKITTITEVKKVRVDFVVHPVTMEKVDYNQAVMEGKLANQSRKRYSLGQRR